MSNTLLFKFCPMCGERLSYTSYEGYCAYSSCCWNNDECPLPDQNDQGARLAAAAQADQVEDTPTPITPTAEDYDRDFLELFESHGSVSRGAFVLLALANIGSPFVSNSTRVESFESLLFFAQACIGAGCEPRVRPSVQA